MSNKIFNIIAIVLVLLPIIFYSLTRQSYYFGDMDMNRAKSITAPSLPQVGGIQVDSGLMKFESMEEFAQKSREMMPPIYQPYNTISNAVSDTREYLKVTYSATIATWDNVSETVNKVKDLVKKYDGRVDNFQDTKHYGSVGFVIPKDELDKFRAEMKGITYKKLFEDSVTQTNLLSEKKNLESRGENLEKRKELNETVKSEVFELKNQISIYSSKISKKVTEKNILDKNDINYFKFVSDIDYQVANLKSQQKNLVQQYNNLLAGYNFTEQQLKEEKGYLQKENINFFDKIETVEGNVNVQNLDIFEILSRFVPFLSFLFHPFAIFYVILFVVLFYVRKKFVVHE